MGGSPRTLLGSGQVEMVEKPPWWLCQSGEDVTSGVLMEKAIWDVCSGLFNGTVPDCKKRCHLENELVIIGHHQDLAPCGRSGWVVIMILISQRGGKLRQDSTQIQKPSHGANPTKVPKTGFRLEVLCKGLILSCPVQSQQKYAPFPPLHLLLLLITGSSL